MAHNIKRVTLFGALFSFLLLKVLVLNYVYKCVLLGVCTCMQVPRRILDLLKLEWQVLVSCPLWFLRTELGSSASTALAAYLGAQSSAFLSLKGLSHITDFRVLEKIIS